MVAQCDNFVTIAFTVLHSKIWH